MRKHGIIFVMLLALFPAAPASGERGRLTTAASARTARTSKIAGVVLDALGARIVDATIRIERAGFRLEVQSSEEGEFEVELPAGAYRITVEKYGFRRFELSPFRARANVREVLSVRMEVKPPPSTLKI